MAGLRRDAFSGLELLVAPERAARTAARARCPFCPGHESDSDEPVLVLPPSGDWQVRVVPNRYPLVTEAGKDGIAGRHEVIIETRDHDLELDQQPDELRLLTFVAYRERYRALLAQPGIRFVTVFKNRGGAAGTSLAHPHSQVVALSQVPLEVQRLRRRARRRAREGGGCPLCQSLRALAREPDGSGTAVVRNADFVAYVPADGPFPAGVRVAPARHVSDFGATSDSQLAALSGTMGSVLAALRSAFADPPYNLLLRSWPASRSDEFLHWYLELVPRRTTPGGFELSTGIGVTITTPEDAAAALRGALARA